MVGQNLSFHMGTVNFSRVALNTLILPLKGTGFLLDYLKVFGALCAVIRAAAEDMIFLNCFLYPVSYDARPHFCH